MKGIILAAGFGIRLESITMHKPKSMIKVCGKPILEYQLDAYQEAGVDEIIIVTGYKSNVIENYIQENGYENVKIIKNNDYQNTNNMYSLWLCRDILLASEQTFISNADVIFDKSVVKRISNYLCDYIVCDKGSYNDESMKITLNSNGFVNDISKTINENNSFGSSIDLYFLTNKTANALVSKMDEIIEKEKNQWTEIALQSLLKTETVNMLPFCLDKEERWFEIDTMDDLIQAEGTFSSFQKRFVNKKVFIFDLDGTIYIGNDPIDDVSNLISELQENGHTIKFLSNNSSKDKNEYVQKLKSHNIYIRDSQIILSTDVVIKYLNENGYTSGYVIGTNSMLAYLRDKGIHHSLKNPEFVLLGYDTELTYTKIQKASILIYSGLPYFATHEDKFCPTMEGPIPDAGSFIEMFETVTNRRPLVFGKPEKQMIEYLTDGKSNLDDYVFIGDRLHTDFAMAKLIGVDFVCVLTGETIREDIETEGIWPSLIINSAADLLRLL